MTWLAAWALAKRGLSTSGWPLLCIALALFGAVQTIRVWAEQRHSGHLQTQLTASENARKSLQSTLDTLAAKSKSQQQSVTKTIDHYITVTKPVVRTEVQRVESAPLPGSCKTPAQIMDLDI